MCNHWLGILNDYDQSEMNNLYLDSFKEAINERALISRKLASASGFFTHYHPKDYIDKRRGLAKLFNYCPYCGIKINWTELRKELN